MAAPRDPGYLSRAIRLLLVWSLLSVGIWQWGSVVAEVLVPSYRWMFAELTDNYRTQYLRIEACEGEPCFKIGVVTEAKENPDRAGVPTGLEVSSTVPRAYVFQPAIIAWSLLAIWPLRTAWQRPALLMLSVPFLAMHTLLDVPVVLLGALDDLVLYNFRPDLVDGTPSIGMMHVLNGGGRLAMGIVIAGVVILISNAVLRRPALQAPALR